MYLGKRANVRFWPLATNALASHLILPHVEDLP